MALVTLATQHYTVLVHPSLEGLSKEVDALIIKGWIPLGGPSATPSGKFMQALYMTYEPKKGKK